jgi:hypothetical protein
MFLSFSSILQNMLKQCNNPKTEKNYNFTNINVTKLSEYPFNMKLANIKSCEIYEKYNKRKVPRFLLLNENTNENENENENENTKNISKYKDIFLVSGFIFLSYFYI